jgi:hypothetical protein
MSRKDSWDAKYAFPPDRSIRSLGDYISGAAILRLHSAAGSKPAAAKNPSG